MNNMQITLVGNLVNDPEQYGNLLSFRIACNDSKLNKQTNQYEDTSTAFWNIKILRKSLFTACTRELHKGTRIIIQGHIQGTEYTNKQTGQTVHGMEIIAENIGISLKPESATMTSTPTSSAWNYPTDAPQF